MKRMTVKIAILGFCLCALAAFPALAADKPMVRVSGQPTMHGMPTWEVMEQGDKDLPIQLKYTLFPSGAPQVEALAAGEWDVGAIGTVPMMMSSIRYGALMIGISNNESETNDLWVRAGLAAAQDQGLQPEVPRPLRHGCRLEGQEDPVHHGLHRPLRAVLHAEGPGPDRQGRADHPDRAGPGRGGVRLRPGRHPADVGPVQLHRRVPRLEEGLLRRARRGHDPGRHHRPQGVRREEPRAGGRRGWTST